MKKIINVYGSAKCAVPVYVGKSRIDVHTNIKPATDPETGEPLEGLYIYDEEQYTRDEYHAMNGERGAETREDTDDLQDTACQFDIDIEDIKEALCDIDERLG